ncbi:HAD-IIIA family hydrolase [Alkalihalobacillus sp. AL-G]|uniref:D-glycero-alpha-D-manno-heptose-1,7-bisphosphate 7-phosphatase n=1 Tax=Alkalihalobacillus sp. AL-G TaxID=2926399 RepID=UPI00272B4825|nr:HAD-IIIA family hydrolase [Alkalihalobacillus sp. AL-G]WLD93911.1 HAD-IIIA family hydrolase [Alkalihalobacillus sp. AL-G]
MKAAFFDRDGTIIRDYPDEDWSHVQDPEFIDGSLETLSVLRKQGYHIIIITNQYLINEGYITFAQYKRINDKMLDNIREYGVNVADVFHCPHRRDEGCVCIKPNKGMVDQALKKYPKINLSESFIVGDSISDMELAVRCRMKGYWISPSARSNNPLITRVDHIKEIILLFE